MEGWIKLHRAISKHWIFSHKDPGKALSWIDLVLQARHKDGEMLIKGRVVKMKRGQVGMSQLTLQKRWGWSQNRVKRYLLLLKKHSMIDFETNDLTTIITICNYDSYQDKEIKANDHTDDQSDDHTDDQSDDKQEGKKGKNGNKSNGIFDPPDLNECFNYFSEKGTTEIEAEKFFNFYESKNWMVGKNKMKNWHSSASGWILRNKTNNTDNGIGTFK